MALNPLPVATSEGGQSRIAAAISLRICVQALWAANNWNIKSDNPPRTQNRVKNRIKFTGLDLLADVVR